MLCLAGALWSKKLLSVVTDGASNMTGPLQGAMTRFEENALPGFFRFW